MKKLLICLAVIFFTINIKPQNVKVSDYQVPISKAKTLRFNGAWNWAQTGSSVTSNNADANLIYRSFYSSLPLAWFINLDANGGWNFDQKINYNHNVNLDASFRKYIWNNRNWFGQAEFTASHLNTYKQVATDLTVGFGYGRYINATALAKAVRIEDHLLKDKVIKDFLPKDIMIKIANIIERENEFKDIYGDTYETYWFEAIEKEILKSNLVEGNKIGSLGIFRMRQVLFNINERVNQRYYGWDVTLGILFPISTPDKSPAGAPNLSVTGRYSIPISWKSQINSKLNVYSPLDSLFFKNVSVRANVDFIYELSNRINFVSNYNFLYNKTAESGNYIEHNLNASFWYYLENNIYLTISAGYFKQGNNPKDITSRVGLQYNLF